MKMALGCDYGGEILREEIATYVRDLGHEVVEYFPQGGDCKDYPTMEKK